jgi:hypothetical protein
MPTKPVPLRRVSETNGKPRLSDFSIASPLCPADKSSRRSERRRLCTACARIPLCAPPGSAYCCALSLPVDFGREKERVAEAGFSTLFLLSLFSLWVHSCAALDTKLCGGGCTDVQGWVHKSAGRNVQGCTNVQGFKLSAKRKEMAMKEDSLTALVWQHAPSRYNGTALVVLLKLAGLSSNKGGYAFPGVERLAAMCGVKERRLQYVTRQLKKANLLKVRERRGHSNMWFLNAEELRKLPLASPPPEPEMAGTAASPATEFAERLQSTMSKIEGTVIPADWHTAWTAEAQKLLDANLDLMRDVTRFALTVLHWRELVAKNGPSVLVQNFAQLLEAYHTHGKAA